MGGAATAGERGAHHGIYLDFAATGPVCAEAAAAMAAVQAEAWANPSSPHGPGRRARALVEVARGQVAGLMGADPARVVFTSGGTEANNLAVAGAAAARPSRRHLVVSAIEHHCVLDAVLALEGAGYTCEVIRPGPDGIVSAAAMAAALRPDSALCALMLANNEVGAIQPVAEVAQACRACGVPLLVDAVAAAGRLPLDVARLGADFLTLSAHKLGGPKGAGALYVAAGQPLVPLLRGGGQERGWRPGTENVAAIVGFGVAAARAADRLGRTAAELEAVGRRLDAAVRQAVPGVRRTGPPPGPDRLPGLCSYVLPGLDQDALLVALDLRGIWASSGSACTSGSLLPSHVLVAMGQPAGAALRLSVGPGIGPTEVAAVAAALAEVVALQG